MEFSIHKNHPARWGYPHDELETPISINYNPIFSRLRSWATKKSHLDPSASEAEAAASRESTKLLQTCRQTYGPIHETITKKMWYIVINQTLVNNKYIYIYIYIHISIYIPCIDWYIQTWHDVWRIWRGIEPTRIGKFKSSSPKNDQKGGLRFFYIYINKNI